MSGSLPFFFVDVFAGTPLTGNPSKVAPTMAAATTNSATGLPGSHFSPASNSTIATAPMASTRSCTCPSCPIRA